MQGSEGVEGVMNTLKDELRVTMQLAGNMRCLNVVDWLLHSV